MPEYTKKEKKEFKEIILDHLEQILKITCNEFKGGYWKKEVKGNYIEEIYIPDSRKCYIQAVESWSDVLNPHFTPQIRKEYNKIIIEVNTLLKSYGDNKIEKNDYVIKKLRLMRKLFLLLNKFLKEAGVSKLKKERIIG